MLFRLFYGNEPAITAFQKNHYSSDSPAISSGPNYEVTDWFQHQVAQILTNT